MVGRSAVDRSAVRDTDKVGKPVGKNTVVDNKVCNMDCWDGENF